MCPSVCTTAFIIQWQQTRVFCFDLKENALLFGLFVWGKSLFCQQWPNFSSWSWSKSCFFLFVCFKCGVSHAHRVQPRHTCIRELPVVVAHMKNLHPTLQERWWEPSSLIWISVHSQWVCTFLTHSFTMQMSLSRRREDLKMSHSH